MIQSAYVFAKQTQCTENSACIRIFCTKISATFFINILNMIPVLNEKTIICANFVADNVKQSQKNKRCIEE